MTAREGFASSHVDRVRVGDPDAVRHRNRVVARGSGARVGHDHPAGRAAPLPDRLVAALRDAGATEEDHE